MSTPPPAFSAALILPWLLALGIIGLSKADNSVSDVIGVTRISCAGGADNWVGVPYERSPALESRLEANPDIQGEEATLFPELDSPMNFDEFGGGRYSVRFVGDILSGAWFEILSNTGTEITIDLRGIDLSPIQTGAPFEVVPFWTLDTLLPPDSQLALHVSSGKLPPERQSLLMLPDSTSKGVSLAPNRIFFLTAEGWFRSGKDVPSAGDHVIRPGEPVVIRNPPGSANTVFQVMQRLDVRDHWQVLRTNIDAPQDNFVSLPRPEPIALEDLDLDDSAFLDSASPDPADRADQLLLYDNLDAAINRVHDRIYFRVGGTWLEDDGASYPVADTFEAPTGAALVIRKVPTDDGSPVIWVNSPRY